MVNNQKLVEENKDVLIRDGRIDGPVKLTFDSSKAINKVLIKIISNFTQKIKKFVLFSFQPNLVIHH